MEVITLNGVNYQVIKNVRDAISIEEIEPKLTEYFDDFDFIVGDIAYSKLRLKGFNNSTNKNFKPINDVNNVEEYIKNNCAYGCRWFMISKIKD